MTATLEPPFATTAARAHQARTLEWWQDLAKRVDTYLEAFLPRQLDAATVRSFTGAPAWEHDVEASTAALSRPIWDLLDRKGKRWRPIFGMLMLETLGVDVKPYETLVCTMAELPHTGSLIIDDIQDASLLRRKDACIHQRYGDAVAINAANTLYFLPFLHIFEHPALSPEKRARVTEIVIRHCISAHFGQGWDIHWSGNLNPANLETWLADSFPGKVLQMYHYKTGALVEGLAEVAAIIAEAAESVRRACMDFARDFSVAFQITDDVHNYSESSAWTKEHAEDFKEGKLTYVVVTALQRLPPAERRRLAALLCDPALRREPAGLAEGVALVKASGAAEACRAEAEALSQKSWDAFAAAVPNSWTRLLLRVMTLHLLRQDYDQGGGG